MLATAEQRDFCKKTLLIAAQNCIVDSHFWDTDYRRTQNYIGETISFQQQRVHYICPKPENIADLMAGLIAAYRTLKSSDVPAIVHSAIISYGFVFMHPFEDGNVRLHRFLIHNILSQRGRVPEGLMFPVSAAMLKNRVLYSTSLEKYSITLLQLIDYNLELHLQLSVVSATDRPTGSCEEQSKHTWIAKKKRNWDGLSDFSKAEGASKSSLATLPAVKNIHHDHSTQDSLNWE